MSDTSRDSGIGLCGAMFIVFLILRLTDHIDWAWYWVAAPLWMPPVLVLGIAACILVFVYPVAAFIDWRKHVKRLAQRSPSKSELINRAKIR